MSKRGSQAAHEICRLEYEHALEARLRELEGLLAAVRRLARSGAPDLALRIARQLEDL